MTSSRSLRITEELVRAYSRRGNYHSEPETSSTLGLPGLVVQGVQAAGPAYALLLDAWGEEFLAHGEIEMRFVGLVLAGDTVGARAVLGGDGAPGGGTATFEVTNATRGHTAVVGAATGSRPRGISHRRASAP